ncbi:MAG TPA: winged helix-turn-helix domain-containing protein [Methanocorpusculum sp.]|nr:winged helix-turn-helix domain-containing protein [Methanocorpusculum sp.]
MQRTMLPNSCISILQLLEGANSLTHKDIVEKSGLAPRTVRYALRRLKEADLIVEKFNFHDARQSNYLLKVPQNNMAAV